MNNAVTIDLSRAINRSYSSYLKNAAIPSSQTTSTCLLGFCCIWNILRDLLSLWLQRTNVWFVNVNDDNFIFRKEHVYVNLPISLTFRSARLSYDCKYWHALCAKYLGSRVFFPPWRLVRTASALSRLLICYSAYILNLPSIFLCWYK